MEIGDKVTAKIDLLSDMRDEGMGMQLCANKGDELIVRGKSEYSDTRFHVSRPNCDYIFCADDYELELAASENAQKEVKDGNINRS